MWSIVKQKCLATTIPDGNNIYLLSGQRIYITKILGGMFSAETENGQYIRIHGKYATNIGQDIPNECKKINKEQLTHYSLEEIAWKQLKTCYDPEIPVNIVELGLIYKVHISIASYNTITVTMTLTSPGCAMSETLKEDVEQKLMLIDKIKKVYINIVFKPTWNTNMMSRAAKLHLGLM